jgi:hypothetical protein
MNLITIDHEELRDIFKFNKSATWKVKEVDTGSSKKLKILTINDFYKNPEKVRDWLGLHPHSFDMTSGAFMWRGLSNANLIESASAIIEIIRKTLDPVFEPAFHSTEHIQSFMSCAITNYLKGCPEEHLKRFESTLSSSEFSIKKNISRPHADPNSMTCSVWLCGQNNAEGGTGFYRHRTLNIACLDDIQDALAFKTVNSKNEFKEKLNKNANRSGTKLVADSNDHYDLYHLEKIKFNQAIIYDGSFLHSAYLKKGFFKNEARLNQMFFIPTNDKSNYELSYREVAALFNQQTRLNFKNKARQISSVNLNCLSGDRVSLASSLEDPSEPHVTHHRP